ERFEQATVDVKRLKNASNSEKLEFYGLFKQANGETFDASKRKDIGLLDIAGKAKHDAWGKVSDVSVEEAQEKYIELFEKLKAKYGLTEKEEK
ncbi:hypothetical protein F66182_17731, partial [Fusarium sp. NRRL 66182]